MDVWEKNCDAMRRLLLREVDERNANMFALRVGAISIADAISIAA